jgi:metal-responsive CopG/Arc/MetJ family transcriptional regulator
MYNNLAYRYVNVIFMKRDEFSQTMADVDYLSVRLPKELIAEVDRLVDRKALGFRSRAEFIADAIRRRLEQIPELEKASRKSK